MYEAHCKVNGELQYENIHVYLEETLSLPLRIFIRGPHSTVTSTVKTMTRKLLKGPRKG